LSGFLLLLFSSQALCSHNTSHFSNGHIQIKIFPTSTSKKTNNL